jgi:rubrerythrin
MANLTGSRTEQNLLKAFAGESQARNRYTYFSSQAKKEGYEQICWIFSDTADNEKEHAKRFFTFLEGGDLEVTASFPSGRIGTTADNLKAAAAGENHEWSTLYPEFAQAADEEGFADIAKVFREIAKAETGHEKRYLALLKNVEAGQVFKKAGPAKWRCRNCGYISEGPEAPAECPACAHAQAHYELFSENY